MMDVTPPAANDDERVFADILDRHGCVWALDRIAERLEAARRELAALAREAA